VGPVAMVTELGDPLDTVRLLQLSWEDRLRVWTALVVWRNFAVDGQDKEFVAYSLLHNKYKASS
jgi:hypothetical protein